MYVCISQAFLESHNLSFKVFPEIIHLTFQSIDFSIRSPANILGKVEALLKLLSAVVYFVIK